MSSSESKINSPLSGKIVSSNTIPYIEYKEFKKKYPIQIGIEPLSSGSFATGIYQWQEICS